MRRAAHIAFPLAGMLGLAACSAEEEIAFRSEQERACYIEAAAALQGSRTRRLVRGQDGGFVIVTQVEGLVRDIAPAPTFQACMARGSAAPASTGGRVFTGEDLVIWNSLNEAAKRDALVFLDGGGTLRDFVGQG